MDAKWRGRIISTLRKLTFSYKPRNEAKAKRKRGPAVYECALCNIYVYEGSSDKNYKKLCEDYPNLIKGKIHMDHETPVIPLEGFKTNEFDWTLFINNLFCDESNFQGICSNCHKEKTNKEKKLRKELKNRKKI